MMDSDVLPLDAIERCFAGAIPAILCTASADGIPNVTFLSKALRVDDERIALSNQFMSKTARNLAANPRASLLLIDPVTADEYRLSLVYERTDRRGHVFERLRHDVDVIAEMGGMQDVFRLRAATIFRVVEFTRIEPHPSGWSPTDEADPAGLSALAVLATRIGRCGDLDVLIDTTLDGLEQLLGFRHVHLLLLDEKGRHLYAIASRGFEGDSVGAEVIVGEGHVGVAAARCEPVRIGNLRQMDKYSRSIVQQYTDAGGVRPGRELRMPGLAGADSRLVVPVMSLGQLVGVVVADSARPAAFGAEEEHVLGVVATMLGTAIEHVKTFEGQPDVTPAAASTARRHRTQPWSGPSCASSTSTAARSSTASTSSRASPGASSGRYCVSTSTADASTSPTVSCASTPASNSPDSRTTWRAG